MRFTSDKEVQSNRFHYTKYSYIRDAYIASILVGLL
jgi:ubiquinone biosynthesis protein COQ9